MRTPAIHFLLIASSTLALALTTVGCGGGDNTSTADMSTCNAPEVNCVYSCANLMTDSGNCGKCGHSCLATQHCAAGVCISEKCGTKSECGDSCVDTMTDSAHCGACFAACQMGQPCVGGKCMTACDPGLTPCGGMCVDAQRDKANCGTCGNACRLGERCFHGACQLDICGSRQLGMPGPAMIYTAGPNDLLAGDLDMDGDVDLIIAGGSDVGLWLSNPNDHTLMRMALTSKAPLTRPVLGDWNNDLKNDLAFIDATNKQVVVLKGDTKNNFTAFATVPIGGTGPWLLFSGPIDGDTRPDLAAVSLPDGVITIALNQMNTSFKVVNPPPPRPDARAVVAMDLNADNKMDFAIADKDGALALLLGLGDGTFNAALAVTTPFPVRQLAGGDVDANGRNDLGIVGDSKSAILFNTKNNPFPVWMPSASVDSPAQPQVARLADADGDMTLDLVVGRDGVGRAEGGSVFVFLSDGKMGLKAGSSWLDEAKVVSLAPADFDADGRLDLAFGQEGHDYSVGVLRGVGAGAFATPTVSDAKAEVTVLAGGDLDGDGAAELIVGTSTIDVWKNDGNGRFSKGDALDAATFVAAAVVDLDGDKKNDVAVFDGKANVLVYLNQGGGKLGPALKTASFGNAPYMAFGDLDVDGKMDMVQLGVPGVMVHKGLGKGAFDAPVTYKAAHTGPLLIGDFNNDSWPDVIIVDTPKSIATLVNKTRGILAAPVSYPGGTNNTSITSGDINNDGKLDLVTASTLAPGMGGLISVILNDGDATFKAAADSPYPFAIPAAVLGDVDGDHYPDLVGALQGPELRGLGVWRNSKGRLLPLALYPGVRGGALPILADGDGDGRLDAITAALPPGGMIHQSLTVSVSSCLP